MYQRENSLDVQNIARPDGSYDFITLTHVLEYVPDDQRAFAELARIGSDRCIVHLVFASSLNVDVTRERERPGPLNRYRDYGADAPTWFRADRHGFPHVVVVESEDLATMVWQRAHFFCRQLDDMGMLITTFRRGGLRSSVWPEPPRSLVEA
jgi:hypothetical protein